MTDGRASRLTPNTKKEDSFNIFDEESMGHFDESRPPTVSGYFDRNRLTNPQTAPAGTSQLGRNTTPVGQTNAPRNNSVLSQINDSPMYNPYAFPAAEQNPLGASAAPKGVKIEPLPLLPPTMPSANQRESQVLVGEQAAQIAALKHMVQDYERQLSEARATASVRRSAMPGNHVDATKDLLNNYETTITNLKADLLRYQGMDAKVYELENDKRKLEDEIDRARKVKITLENQLERWQGVEGNLPEWKAKCSKLEIENVRYQNEIKRLRTENEYLLQKLKDIEGKGNEIKKYETEINTYILKMRDYEEEINFLKEEKKAVLANERGRNSNIVADIEKLRERNAQLEGQNRQMQREVEMAKATQGQNNIMVSKVKLLENENEGLKSMLSVNQKIPKNMIFNDDVRPSGPVAVDNTKLFGAETQLVLARLEIARLFEENRELRKENNQNAADLNLVKNKLLRKTGKSGGLPLSVSEVPGGFGNVDGRSTISKSQKGLQASSLQKNNDPWSDPNMPPPLPLIIEPKKSAKFAEPETQQSAFSKSAQPKQVTFDDKILSNEPPAPAKSNFTAQSAMQNPYLKNSMMMASNAPATNKPSNIMMNESLDFERLDDMDDSAPRFGNTGPQKSQLDGNRQTSSQYPGQNPNNNTTTTTTTTTINKTTLYIPPVPLEGSQVPLQGNRIAASQLANPQSQRANQQLQQSTLPPTQTAQGVSQFMGQSNMPQPPVDLSQSRQQGGPSSNRSTVQQSALNQLPIDPVMASQYQGQQNRSAMRNMGQSAMPQIPIDPMLASQYPNQQGQGGDKGFGQSIIPIVAIDPMMASQYPNQQVPNNRKNLDQSAFPQIPIDPLLASQYPNQQVGGQGKNINQSALSAVPINPMLASQYNAQQRAPTGQQGGNIDQSALPLVVIDPLLASQYPNQQGQGYGGGGLGGQGTTGQSGVNLPLIVTDAGSNSQYPNDLTRSGRPSARAQNNGEQNGNPFAPSIPLDLSSSGAGQQRKSNIQQSDITPSFKNPSAGGQRPSGNAGGSASMVDPNNLQFMDSNIASETNGGSARRSNNVAEGNRVPSTSPNFGGNRVSPGDQSNPAFQQQSSRNISPNPQNNYSSNPSNAQSNSQQPNIFRDLSNQYASENSKASQLRSPPNIFQAAHDQFEQDSRFTQPQGSYAPPGQSAPIVKTLQPIYLPESAYNRNVIFTNDGKQMLIPIGGGTSTMKRSASALPVALDQMGVHHYGHNHETPVQRIINDGNVRSKSPAKKEFMPLIFSGANDITVTQSLAPNRSQQYLPTQSEI